MDAANDNSMRFNPRGGRFKLDAPFVIFEEPYRSLINAEPVLPRLAPAILGISASQIRELQEIDLLPYPTCDHASGAFAYDRLTLVRIRWALNRKSAYSDAVNYWLQRGIDE